MDTTQTHIRPYWHVDIKWMTGIVAFFSLGLALLLGNLVVLTTRENATTITTVAVANLFSRDGLDSDEGLDELRAQIAATDQEVFVPIEQFPGITLTKEQVLELSSRDLRLAIFRQITEPIYDQGLKNAAASLIADSQQQEAFIRDASLLGVVTAENHEALKVATVIASSVALVFFVLSIGFSARWGRPVTAGVLLLLVSPVGAVIGALLRFSQNNTGLSQFPVEIQSSIGYAMTMTYGVAFILGWLLLVVAGIGKIIQGSLRKRR